MLTGTYAMVALSLEHSQLLAEVQGLRQQLCSGLSEQCAWSEAALSATCADLDQLLDQCRARKAQRYLAPALRHLAEAASLLEQSSAWERAAEQALQQVRAAGVPADQAARQACCADIDTVCAALQACLELDQCELLPMARQRLSPACWFELGQQLLAEAGRSRRPSVAPRAFARPRA